MNIYKAKMKEQMGINIIKLANLPNLQDEDKTMVSIPIV
jgi:hypothetical protein